MSVAANILFTSVGRRNCLIQYFKNELKDIGKLIAADCSKLASALYSADKYYIVPRIDNPDYINVIKNICIQQKITAIISLIDPELSLLAKHSEEFREIGVTVIVSPYEACELWLDKYLGIAFCKDNGFEIAKTYNTFSSFKNALNNKEISFPVFIKPQYGSASQNIHIARNMKEVRSIFEATPNMIIQEFLNGQELGIDVYIDMLSRQVVSIFIKEKLSMRAGETDKARSIKLITLFEKVEALVTKAGLIGPIDIDVFIVNGKYYISEVNPRFGGGYPLAYECGVNFPKYIINNLMGLVNKPEIGNYEENIFMMKHDTVTIKKDL